MATLACSMSMSAQFINVYQGGTVIKSYSTADADNVVVAEAVPSVPTHEYVEIGGLKWATMNLGATTVAGSPSTCYGDYYAWSETEPRYTSITITDAKTATFGGWYSSHSSGYSNEHDYPSYLDITLCAARDAATQKWGAEWKTPTSKEFEELTEACTGSKGIQTPSVLSTSTPTGGIYWLPADQTYLPDYSGVAGILFVDKTDTNKRLFFPATGYCYDTGLEDGGSLGCYWANDAWDAEGNAYMLGFDASEINPSSDDLRSYGCTVRPVAKTSSISGHVINLYKGNTLVQSYTAEEADSVIFAEIAPTPVDPNLLPGKFSVSDTKQVQFSKSNLYWDGTAFHFEANQIISSTYLSNTHVSHFFWTTLTDYQSGNADYMPYAENYKYSTHSASDKFWCGEDNPLTVEGTSGLYALTGGNNGEWNYLFKSRTNTSNLYKHGVTVSYGGKNYANCLIIAPDDYTETLKESYTLDEVNAAGLVCLPAAGYRIDSAVSNNYKYGYFWSATPDSDGSDFAYGLYFDSSKINTASSIISNYGNSLRLVK